MIYKKYLKEKYKYPSGEFWCRGSNADKAGKHAKKMQKYICKQLGEDQAGEQRSTANS